MDFVYSIDKFFLAERSFYEGEEVSCMHGIFQLNPCGRITEKMARLTEENITVCLDWEGFSFSRLFFYFYSNCLFLISHSQINDKVWKNTTLTLRIEATCFPEDSNAQHLAATPPTCLLESFSSENAATLQRSKKPFSLELIFSIKNFAI